MKYKFILIIILISVVVKSQIKNNIGTVKTLKIYGNGKVVIGTIVIQQTLETKIFLLNSTQQSDSTGTYTTFLGFGNKSKLPMFGVDITIKFSDSVISVNGATPGNSLSAAAGTNIYGYISKNSKELVFKAAQVNQQLLTDNMIVFEIKSKKKITFSIYGVDGILND